MPEVTETIMTVAFIVATVAFFKKQFNFSGKASLACAFVVALAAAVAPVAVSQYPLLEPWLTALFRSIVLFISAAGSVDAVNQFRK